MHRTLAGAAGNTGLEQRRAPVLTLAVSSAMRFLLLVLVAVALVAAKQKRDMSHVQYVHVIFMNHLGALLSLAPPISLAVRCWL
jgi:hypothetical protein